jgi:hypothetical protein
MLKQNGLPNRAPHKRQITAELEHSNSLFGAYLRRGTKATVPSESVGTRVYDQRTAEGLLAETVRGPPGSQIGCLGTDLAAIENGSDGGSFCFIRARSRMGRPLGQEGRAFLFEHWQPTDESGIESERAIFAGEVSAPPLPDGSRGHASAFVRRDRGRPARPSCDPPPARIQFDQLAAQLAGAVAQVNYAGEHLPAASKARRQIRDSVSRASDKRVCLVSLGSSGRLIGVQAGSIFVFVAKSRANRK